jgi:hypothetical protein
MPKDKDRIPQAGETVYRKDDTQCVSMYLEGVYTRDNVEYGFCVWTTYDMFDDELIEKDHEKQFLLSELSVYPYGTF